MNWAFQYTPLIWPMLASSIFIWALSLYCWRHRSSPGALALAWSCALASLWAIGNACQLASADPAVQFWWFRFQMLISTPSAVAALGFVLQYAGLGHWLTRTTLTLLIAPSILMLPAYLLDDGRLLWVQVGNIDGRFVRVLSPLGTAWNLYGLAILASTVAVAMHLFVRSPLYRKPAALMMLGHSTVVAVQVFEMRLPAPILQPSLMILSIDLALALYAIALFHYRLFRVVPVARDSAVERMPDAMIVLDAGNRIADLNLAAQGLLGVRRERILGREAASALAAVPGLSALAECRAPAEGEVSLEEGGARHWYWVNASPLEDGHSLYLGRLMVLHETTDLRLARERLLQQERAVAALQERERVARELHDGIGQVLGYVSMQVEATRRLLEDRQAAAADTQLARLAGVARDAHADVRGFILDLRAAPSEQRPLLSALDRYLEGYGRNYDVQTALDIAPGFEEGALAPEAQGQLFRIVQEALTNARKHGGAKSVEVRIEAAEGRARVVIQDDGSGLDPAALSRADGNRFGLQFMRERAEELGGRVEVDSTAGRGTRVVVEVPLGLARDGGGAYASPAR